MTPVKRRETGQGGRKTRNVGKGRPAPISWATARCEATRTGWLFVMPDLLSVNRIWRRGKSRSTGKAVTYKADKAKEADTAAALKFGRIVALAGELCVTVRWVRERKTGDLDNKAKAVLDLLRGIAYADDKQVARIEMVRVDGGPDAPGLYVTVEPIAPEIARAA